MTGLPTETESRPSGVPSTMAELLSLRKTEKAEKPKEEVKEGEAKDKKLDEVDAKLRQMLFKGKPKKEPAKEVAKTEEETPEDPKPEDVAETPAPAKAPAKVTKKVVVKDRASELRERELELEREKLALERERLELEKANKQQKPAQQQDNVDLSILSPDERYELEVFQVMAKDSKYADLPQRFTDVAKATAKYKAQWEKDNPGEVFNPDDSDHDAFFAKNQVKYDKRDFKKAEHRLATEGETDPKIEKLEQTNKELLAREKLRELQPVVTEAWLKHAGAMVEAIDPDIFASAKAGGREQMEKDFPEESKEILQAAEALGHVTLEAYKLLSGDGLFAPERGNRVHERILDIIRTQERLIPQQPKDQQLDADGRQFATWEQWAAMTPQQQANHWHMGPDEVADVVASGLAGRVKYELERAAKIGESRINRRSGAQKGSDNGVTVKEKPQESRSPAASPSSANKVTVDTPAKGKAPADDKFTKIIRSALFNRSS